MVSFLATLSREAGLHICQHILATLSRFNLNRPQGGGYTTIKLCVVTQAPLLSLFNVCVQNDGIISSVGWNYIQRA